MPGQRKEGQKLIGCHVEEEFAAAIDAARKGKGKSDFFREALYFYLESLGYKLPENLKFAPDRSGKGGRPKKDAAAAKDSIAPNRRAKSA